MVGAKKPDYWGFLALRAAGRKAVTVLYWVALK